jgi:DNA topoisomerase VI subunit A
LIVMCRDIHYMDVTLFEKQAIVDRAIENIASMLHVPRTALHVVLPLHKCPHVIGLLNSTTGRDGEESGCWARQLEGER